MINPTSNFTNAYARLLQQGVEYWTNAALVANARRESGAKAVG